MESTLRKSNCAIGGAVKEEKRSESDCDEEDHSKVGNGRKDQNDYSMRPPSPKELSCEKQDNQLELAKAEMNEVRQENQRLKMYLDQMMKDYKTLEKQFHNIGHDHLEAPKNSTDTAHDKIHQETAEEPEFVSLCLGRSSSSELIKRDRSPNKVETVVNVRQDKEGGLVLGLDCKFDMPKQSSTESSRNPSPENSLEEVRKEAGETWPPQKSPKTMRSTGDDEVSQQNPAKKARVSVRVRCDTPTMNDGCQWRKYGQKIAKGNPCPRAYYRCSVAPSCPVRKQIQRCSDDMSILITTYEGTHNHPLPHSATAMASSTSAAADMLLSGSSTSGSCPNPSGSAHELRGLNFSLSNNSKSKLPPFYQPNSSISSPCPTITLDLTSSSNSTSSHLNKMPITTLNFPPRYNNTNLIFSSLESNTLPISSNTQSHYYNNQMGYLNFGRQNQENFYQYYNMQKENNIVGPTQKSLQPDSIEAATKAITSDPSFQSALVAALTSIISSGNVKLEQQQPPFPVLSSFGSTNHHPPSNLSFTLPFTSSKTKSTSPEDI